ncbi:MAG: hypothetical protein J6Q38_05740 [Clostridia bacterium]|nr:hypothetical protein [Clostridia bacterium]
MQIFEFIMLACFGLSWPISVYKSIKSKTTQGKSIVFIIAIIIGYVAGIIGKIVNNQLSYVLIIYCFNLIVVSADLVLYFINRKYEKKNIENDKKQFSNKSEFAV